MIFISTRSLLHGWLTDHMQGVHGFSHTYIIHFHAPTESASILRVYLSVASYQRHIWFLIYSIRPYPVPWLNNFPHRKSCCSP